MAHDHATRMSNNLRVLSIGAGYFARFHLEAWNRLDGADVVAVADPDIEKAQEAVGATMPGSQTPQFGADPVQLMAEVSPDIIDIASPPPTHLPLIRAAYTTQARAIICQKPFCGGVEGARLAVARAEADGRPLVVHENFRFQPWFREISRIIERGDLGELYQISFRLRPGDGQGPDAYLSRQPYFQTMQRFLVHETAVHFIDVFRYLMGDPLEVFADLRRLNPAIAGEDAGLMIFKFPGNRRATFDGNRLADHPARNTRLTMGECLIEGSGGMLMLDGEGQIWTRSAGELSWTKTSFSYPETGFAGDCVHALQAHVLSHLQNGTPLENQARDYLRVQEIEEAVYASAEEGRFIKI